MTPLSHYFDTNQHKINDANFSLRNTYYKQMRERRAGCLNFHIYFFSFSFFFTFRLMLILVFLNSFNSVCWTNSCSSRERYVIECVCVRESNWRWWYIENNQHIFAWQFNAANTLLVFWSFCFFFFRTICFGLFDFFSSILNSSFSFFSRRKLIEWFIHASSNAKRVVNLNLNFQKPFWLNMHHINDKALFIHGRATYDAGRWTINYYLMMRLFLPKLFESSFWFYESLWIKFCITQSFYQSKELK